MRSTARCVPARVAAVTLTATNNANAICPRSLASRDKWRTRSRSGHCRKSNTTNGRASHFAAATRPPTRRSSARRRAVKPPCPPAGFGFRLSGLRTAAASGFANFASFAAGSVTRRAPLARAIRLLEAPPGGAGLLDLAWRHQREGHAKCRALSRLRDQRDAAAELLRHQIVDDVEAEAGIALGARGGEERIT